MPKKKLPVPGGLGGYGKPKKGPSPLPNPKGKKKPPTIGKPYKPKKKPLKPTNY